MVMEPLTGIVVPGAYRAMSTGYVRFAGYLGHAGPPPDYLKSSHAMYIDWGSAASWRRALMAALDARRR